MRLWTKAFIFAKSSFSCLQGRGREGRGCPHIPARIKPGPERGECSQRDQVPLLWHTLTVPWGRSSLGVSGSHSEAYLAQFRKEQEFKQHRLEPGQTTFYEWAESQRHGPTLHLILKKTRPGESKPTAGSHRRAHSSRTPASQPAKGTSRPSLKSRLEKLPCSLLSVWVPAFHSVGLTPTSGTAGYLVVLGVIF